MNSGALLRIKMSTFCFVFKGTDARFIAEIAQPLKKDDGHYFLRARPGAGFFESLMIKLISRKIVQNRFNTND